MLVMVTLFFKFFAPFCIVILYNKQVLFLQKWERFFSLPKHNFIKVSTVKEFLLKIKQYGSDI